MLLSEKTKPTRAGAGSCAQADAGTSSRARSAALRSFSRSDIAIRCRRGLTRRFFVGNVDDLAVGQAIGRSEPLAVAGAGFARDLVGGDRLTLLDDDLAHAGGVGLDHRHLAFA